MKGGEEFAGLQARGLGLGLRETPRIEVARHKAGGALAERRQIWTHEMIERLGRLRLGHGVVHRTPFGNTGTDLRARSWEFSLSGLVVAFQNFAEKRGAL